MVWIRFGQGRRRGYGGYGYPGGYGRRGGGGGGCLRDLFLMETGCCLAEAMGCGPQLVLLAPSLPRVLLASGGECGEHGEHGEHAALAVRLVRLYQTRVSAVRGRPCCRMTPSCSAYAVEALTLHGTARGLQLSALRLLRCRPGGRSGHDPVPA